jgi:hypothetical protein
MYAYEIDPRRRLVYCRTWGMITVIDIINVRDALLRDRRFNSTFGIVHELLLEPDTSNVTDDALRALATANNFAPKARRAIVAAEPAHFRVARIIRIHREMSGVISDVLVCRSLEEALDAVGAGGFIPGTLTQVG